MKESEAKACVGLLKSNWPNPEIPVETELEWQTNLEPFRFGLEDFRAAIQLVYEQGRMFCPHASEVAVLAEEFWRDRMANETPALEAHEEADDRPDCCKAEPGLRHWYREHATEEEREKAKEYLPSALVDIEEEATA